MRAIITDFDSHREAIQSVREEVFVNEQCIDRAEEFDEREIHCTHVIVFEGDRAIATGRLDIEQNGRIGRVAVVKEFRGQGVGALVMRTIEQHAQQIAQHRLWFHAQTHAIPFYKKLGYEPYGDEFTEANIPHVTMHKPISAAIPKS